MSRTLPRPLLFTTLFVSVVVLTAASQGAKFPGGFFKGSDGNSTIGLDFDSTGAINVSVDGQAFSTSSWESKADTLVIGPVNGPEGYSCASSAKYLWSIADNRLTFTLVTDDCQSRVQPLTGLIWTKG